MSWAKNQFKKTCESLRNSLFSIRMGGGGGGWQAGGTEKSKLPKRMSGIAAKRSCQILTYQSQLNFGGELGKE